MCCICCSVKQKKILVFGAGTILVILGIVFITAWPKLSEQTVDSVLPLSPHSPTFSKWVITPIRLYFNFYMFNWTNPHLVNDSSVKPHFEELGPYIFREVRIKEDLKWNYDKNIVTFYGCRTWYFDAVKSNGSLQDMITAPHLPTATGANFFRSYHPILRKIVNFALNREGGKLASTNSVRKWIFDGFYDDILDIVARLHSPVLGINENHFAYFYNRNGSKEAEGTFSIHTGRNNLNQLGDIKYWKYETHTKYWREECSRVNGSTGELWAPHKKWNEPVSIFFSDTYRFLNIFPQTNESYRGVEARKYTSTELTFDSGHITEDTKCFCVEGRECPKSGVIDFSPPCSNAPLYMSHPHFHLADASFRENISGLNPDAEKHSVYILLEPKLGIPLYIDGRVQISVFMERDDKIDLFKDLAWNFYAPLFYIQVQATISDDLLRVVKLTLNLPRIGQYFGIALIVIGMLMIGIGVHITKTQKKCKQAVAAQKRVN